MRGTRVGCSTGRSMRSMLSWAELGRGGGGGVYMLSHFRLVWAEEGMGWDGMGRKGKWGLYIWRSLFWEASASGACVLSVSERPRGGFVDLRR